MGGKYQNVQNKTYRLYYKIYTVLLDSSKEAVELKTYNYVITLLRKRTIMFCFPFSSKKFFINNIMSVPLTNEVFLLNITYSNTIKRNIILSLSYIESVQLRLLYHCQLLKSLLY